MQWAVTSAIYILVLCYNHRVCGKHHILCRNSMYIIIEKDVKTIVLKIKI